jgi:predicted nucleic acid-binding protein
MSDIVVDSSVVAKWVISEPDSSHAHRMAGETQAVGGRLVVLDLVFAEVVNVIWKQHRQKLITHVKARESLDDLKRAPVHVEPAARLLDEALEIAIKYDRAVYDALFVALAHDLNLTGVTADEPLYNVTHADFPEIILLRDWT